MWKWYLNCRLVYSPPPYGLDGRMGTSGGVQRRPLVRADAGRGVAALARSWERAETPATWEYCVWVRTRVRVNGHGGDEGGEVRMCVLWFVVWGDEVEVRGGDLAQTQGTEKHWWFV